MLHLLAHWDQTLSAWQQPDLLLAFDYDGTLTLPNREAPDLKLRIRQGLIQLHQPPHRIVAVVSARRLADLIAVVGLPGLIYAGNHGLEIDGPGLHLRQPLPVHTREVYRAILNRLEGKGWPEDKGYTLSLNHGEDRVLRAQLLAEVEPWLASKAVRLCANRQALDVLPAGDWDKGQALLWMQARLESVSGRPRFPVYMGDDQSDEAAFAAIQGQGLTVRVGGVSTPTRAAYGLQDAWEVLAALAKIRDAHEAGRKHR